MLEMMEDVSHRKTMSLAAGEKWIHLSKPNLAEAWKCHGIRSGENAALIFANVIAWRF